MFGRSTNYLALTIQELDNKISFLKECEKLDLNVPKFKILSKDVAKDLKELHAQGMFGISNFFMKNLELQREERSDFTTIPSDDLEFEKYIQNHLRKKDLSIPYFVNEFVEGREFGANVGCIDGKIFMLQVVLCCPGYKNMVKNNRNNLEIPNF